MIRSSAVTHDKCTGQDVFIERYSYTYVHVFRGLADPTLLEVSVLLQFLDHLAEQMVPRHIVLELCILIIAMCKYCCLNYCSNKRTVETPTTGFVGVWVGERKELKDI